MMLYVSVAWVTHPSARGPLIEGGMKLFISDASTTGGDYNLPTYYQRHWFHSPAIFFD